MKASAVQGHLSPADQGAEVGCGVTEAHLEHRLLVAVGKRLRRSRLSRGFTQQRLADAAGVSRSAVAQWETGRMSYGSRLRAIATALTIPLRELRPGDRPDDPSSTPHNARTSDDEDVLIRCYRSLDHTDQACILRLVHRLTLLAAE